jgi:hypothetical protein
MINNLETRRVSNGESHVDDSLHCSLAHASGFHINKTGSIPEAKRKHF